MSRQLSFDLPARTALGREDFFVSSANAMAVALIDTTASWPAHKLILTGPEASGKTHLAHVWAKQQGAQIVSAHDIADADIPALAQGPLALEDTHVIGASAPAQTALFHLHNLITAEDHPLLITARGTPGTWGLSLPDLISRLGAVQMASLEPPDDALLSALLMKHFADRQIFPAPDVIPYLARRMDRSAAAAQQIVTQLDREALAQGRKLTRALAVQVLDKLDRPSA